MHEAEQGWPVVVNAEKRQPTVDISKLKPEQKQQIWKGIQSLNPSLADTLSNDPVLAKIKASFQGSIVITETDAKAYMKAGKTKRSNG